MLERTFTRAFKRTRAADRMSDQWQPLLEAKLNTTIESEVSLGGGDFADSRRLHLTNGDSVFVKTHANPPPNFFTTEATGLTWLRSTHSVAIPEVLFVSDDPPCLALQWIDEGPRVSLGEQQFGRDLAELHRQAFPHFGRADSATTGSLAVPNLPVDDWVSFYRDQRLLPLLKLSQTRNALPDSVCKNLIRLCDQLERLAPLDTSPSLVHGDLWAGNRLVDRNGKSWLIDPAAHGNHREFDLAMMRLFGGYEESCFAAYQEVYPLSDGWQDRVALFQLAPLIVHAIKFGGHYASATASALNACGFN